MKEIEMPSEKVMGTADRIIKVIIGFEEWVLEQRRKFEAKYKHE